MCSANAEAACGEIFPEALYIEYTDPGYTLFKKVYDRINATLGHADSLMIDLKAHPKRYVHFSVFGKKDN